LFFISTQSFAFGLQGIEVTKESSLSKIRDKFGISCYELKETSSCIGDTTIIGKKARLSIVIDDKNIVQSIVTNFDTINFLALSKILTKKYGTPVKKEHEEVRNTNGGINQQERLTWIDTTTVMTLQKYSQSLYSEVDNDECQMMIVTKEVVKDRLESSENAKSGF